MTIQGEGLRSLSFLLLLLAATPISSCDPEPDRDPQVQKAASEQGERGWEAMPYSSISLDHEPYFMANRGQPMFRVQFDRGGAAVLYGCVCDSEWGDFVGKVGLWDYRRLCELISAGVGSLEDQYTTALYHGGTYRLKLYGDPGRVVKEIEEYGDSGPSEFWAIKSAIEAIMARVDWKPSLVDEQAGDRQQGAEER